MLKEIFTSLLILFSTSSNSLVNANSNSFNYFLVSQKSEDSNISSYNINSENYYIKTEISSISITDNVVSLSISYIPFVGSPITFIIQRSINGGNYINIHSGATEVYEDVIDKSLLINGYVINYRIYFGNSVGDFSYSSVASVTYTSTDTSTVNFKILGGFWYDSSDLTVSYTIQDINFYTNDANGGKVLVYLDDDLKYTLNSWTNVSYTYDSITYSKKITYTLLFDNLNSNTRYTIYIKYYDSSNNLLSDNDYVFDSGNTKDEEYLVPVFDNFNVTTNDSSVFVGGDYLFTTWEISSVDIYIDDNLKWSKDLTFSKNTTNINTGYSYYYIWSRIELNNINSGDHVLKVKITNNSNFDQYTTFTDDFTIVTSSDFSVYYEEFGEVTLDSSDKSAVLSSFLLYSNFQKLEIKYYLNDIYKFSNYYTGTSYDVTVDSTKYLYTFDGTGCTFRDLQFNINYSYYVEFWNSSTNTLISTSSSESFLLESAFNIQNIQILNKSYNTLDFSVDVKSPVNSVIFKIYLNDKLFYSNTKNVSKNTLTTVNFYLNDLDPNTEYNLKVIISSDLISDTATATSIFKTSVMPSSTEVINLSGLLFDILSMPFSFISQAFNLTLFGNTAYAINFGNVIMFVISIIILIYLVRLIMSFFK